VINYTPTNPSVLSDGKFPPSTHYTKGDSERETSTSSTPERSATVSSAFLIQFSAEPPTASVSPGNLHAKGHHFLAISYQVQRNLTEVGGKIMNPRCLTSDINFERTATKRKLETKTLRLKFSKKAKAFLVALSTGNEDGSVPISQSEKEENLPCCFCGLK